MSDVTQARQGLSDSEVSILTAALHMTEPRWTSQDIADATGSSQSAVARTWRKVFSPSDLFRQLPAAISITGVAYINGAGYIFAHIDKAEPLKNFTAANQLMRSPRRITCQTLLAGILVESPTSTPLSFDQFSIDESTLVLTTDSSAQFPSTLNAIYIEPHDWQHLLLWLIQSAHPTSAGNFRQLHQHLVAWANKPETAFLWVSRSDLDKRAVVSSTARLTPRSLQQIVADQCFEWIVDRIWSGDLTAGDRITETSLAKALHTTRNQTRDALRTLAFAGLLDHHPVRGVLVPTPTRTDISDIYSARRPLGVEILTRAIANPKLDVSPIKESLDRLIELAKTGNSYETGNADMRFQDAIAESSGMRNIPQMFATLAKQIRIYIAVMGLSYIYSIDDMVKDDTTLFRCIQTRDTDGAIAAWNKKMDDVIDYMTSKVTRVR